MADRASRVKGVCPCAACLARPAHNGQPQHATSSQPYRSGRHQLARTGSKVPLNLLDSLAAPLQHPAHLSKAELLLGEQPELVLLPRLLCELLHRPLPEIGAVCIKVVKSGVLASQVPWGGGVLQPVHASVALWGGEWFSFVSVLAPGSVQRFAQLRCLFQFEGQAFVMLRWLRCLRPFFRDDGVQVRNVLRERGCTHLEWQSPEMRKEGYAVMRLDVQILSRVYLVLDFRAKDKERFYVNSFKWDRVMAAAGDDVSDE